MVTLTLASEARIGYYRHRPMVSSSRGPWSTGLLAALVSPRVRHARTLPIEVLYGTVHVNLRRGLIRGFVD